MSHAVKNYRRVDPDRMHDVRENARRLGLLYSIEVELARLVGGWIPQTPELPEKLELAKILYEEADHARLLESRLVELRVAEQELPVLRRRTARALRQLEHASSPEFLAGLFQVLKPALIADYRRHLDACPPYVDEPTVRIMRRIIREEEEHLGAGLALLAGRGYGWEARADGSLEQGLWDLEVPDGSLLGGEFVGIEPIPLDSPVWPATVEKLPYAEPMPPYPDDFEPAMRRCVHDLVFSETEAMDIFGRYVYEFSEFPWEFAWEASRICWDEARHVELLLNVLERYGGRVGEFPAKAPGYEEFVREPTTLEKIIMVNVIAEGEVSTDTQTQHREAFRELGDELSALLKDYEMADEVSHGKFGLKWSNWLTEASGADFEAAYAHARASLEEFKSMHDDTGGDSPIPLVRLGVDETGDKRLVNVTAKRLLGFSDEEIEDLAAGAKGTIEE